jgi:hypothetical protein
MTTHTLTPNGVHTPSGYTYVGATSGPAALVDDSDSSYVQIAAGVGFDFTLSDLTLPAGAVVKSTKLTFRTNRSAGSAVTAPVRLTAAGLGSAPGLTLTPTTTITSYDTATVTSAVTATELNALRVTAFNNGESSDGVLRFYKAAVTVVVAHRPTVHVTAPTGTVTTTTAPVVSWTYTPGSDGGPQERAQVRIFTAAQWAAEGFDPETSTAEYDSGELAGATLNHAPTEALENGTTYYVHVRAAQITNGVAQWSAWSWVTFDAEADTAEVDSVTATPQNDDGSIEVTVARDTGYQAWNYVRVERSTDNGTTWSPVRGGTKIDGTDEYVTAFSGDLATIVDYEVPNGTAAIYRARAYRTPLVQPPPEGGGGTEPVGISVDEDFSSGTTAADVGFTNFVSSMVVNTGRFRANSEYTDSRAYYATSLESPDHWVEADVVFGNGAAWEDDWPGLIARHGGSGSTTYYLLEHIGDYARTSDFRLSKVISGTRTALKYGDWPVSFSGGNTYRFRLEVSGSTIRFLVDDVVCLEHTDSSITTGNYVGLAHYRESTDTLFDNFAAGSASGSSSGSGESGVNVVVAQNFNVANGTTTTDLGFVSVGGSGPGGSLTSIRTDGGRAEPSTTSTDAYVYHGTPLGSVDHYVEADVVIAQRLTKGGHFAGIMARMRPGSTYTYWRLETYGSSHNVRLLGIVNNVTQYEDYASVSLVPGRTYRFRLECRGTSIKGYVNGSLLFNVTSSLITDGEYAGLKMRSSTADRLYVDNFEAGNFLTSRSITPSGYFNTNAGRIYGPDGAQFHALGVNVVVAASPAANSDSAWTSLLTAQGHADDAAALDMTAVRFIVPDPLVQHRPDYPTTTTDVTRADVLAGLIEAIDEYIAEGIVCLYKIFPDRGPGSNPSLDEVRGSWALEVLDALIAEYKTNPARQLVWLCPMSEPYGWIADDGTGPGADWDPVGTWLYDRCRAAGWDGVIVWELPNQGTAFELAADTTIVSGWLADGSKDRVVVGWNYWGWPTSTTPLLAKDSTIIGRGIPLALLEFGEHRSHSGSSTSSDYEFSPYEYLGPDYAFNAAGAIDQGFGALFWTGGFTTSDESVCYASTGSTFWGSGTKSATWTSLHSELTSPSLVTPHGGGPFTTPIPTAASSGSGSGGGGAGTLIAGSWVSSSSATWSSSDDWLKDVQHPARNVAVVIAEQPAIERARPSGRFKPLGRSRPVVVSDEMGSGELDVTFVTLTDDDAVAVLDLLESAPIVLVQTPATERFGSTFLHVDTVSEVRTAPTVEGEPSRYIKITAVEVDAPEDETA